MRGTAIREERVAIAGDDFWRSTNIEVMTGDVVDFQAEGSWWSGISRTGPAGDKGLLGRFGKPSCSACPVVSGNLGELVGRIASEPPFAIGERTTHYVREPGTIELAMNENLGPCRPGVTGSCYEDNTGIVEVKIAVWRATQHRQN